MFITKIHRPNLAADPDVVTLNGVIHANDEAVLETVFSDPRIDGVSYFDAFVWYSEDDDTAVVRLYKE